MLEGAAERDFGEHSDFWSCIAVSRHFRHNLFVSGEPLFFPVVKVAADSERRSPRFFSWWFFPHCEDPSIRFQLPSSFTCLRLPRLPGHRKGVFLAAREGSLDRVPNVRSKVSAQSETAVVGTQLPPSFGRLRLPWLPGDRKGVFLAAWEGTYFTLSLGEHCRQERERTQLKPANQVGSTASVGGILHTVKLRLLAPNCLISDVFTGPSMCVSRHRALKDVRCTTRCCRWDPKALHNLQGARSVLRFTVLHWKTCLHVLVVQRRRPATIRSRQRALIGHTSEVYTALGIFRRRRWGRVDATTIHPAACFWVLSAADGVHISTPACPPENMG